MSAVAPASFGHAPQPPSDATRLLYERHSGRIFGYCLSLLGSREDAEDAVQTTFINAQRGLRRGVVPKFEVAWLFTIARNVCHNSRQAASRRGRLESARDLGALQDVLAMPERGASVSIGELTRALGAIPERQRRALVLREWQGLSYDEIAQELNVSVAAVETLLFRARRAMAQELQAGTDRRADVLASVLALGKWLFKGGAAPLKIAAATATVATATTLAAAPSLRDHPPAPAPVVPHSHNDASPSRPSGPPQVVRDRPQVPQRSPASNAAIQANAPSTASPAPTPPTLVETAKPASSPPSAERPAAGGVPPPAMTSAELPILPVPETPLPVPEVEAPSVQLPIETQVLPDVPRLVEIPSLPEVQVPELP